MCSVRLYKTIFSNVYCNFPACFKRYSYQLNTQWKGIFRDISFVFVFIENESPMKQFILKFDSNTQNDNELRKNSKKNL